LLEDIYGVITSKSAGRITASAGLPGYTFYCIFNLYFFINFPVINKIVDNGSPKNSSAYKIHHPPSGLNVLPEMRTKI
jgi:hypothetical protein